jgi:hypothetical protein
VVGIVASVSGMPVVLAEGTVAQAPHPVVLRTAVEPESVVLDTPGFVGAAAVLEHPGPPADMATETRLVVAAVVAFEGGKEGFVANLPPIANPERDST